MQNYDQLGFTRSGGYGEFVVAPRRVVHALPDHVSVAAGALVEPASCVGYGFERLSPQAGETIGVVGVGTLGSLAILIARTFSPSAVIAYGITDEDVSQALELGADHAVNLAKEDAEAATVKALGEGPQCRPGGRRGLGSRRDIAWAGAPGGPGGLGWS